MKALLEIKNANNSLLLRQTATLQLLDELEKAAEQLRIYTKRG